MWLGRSLIVRALRIVLNLVQVDRSAKAALNECIVIMRHNAEQRVHALEGYALGFWDDCLGENAVSWVRQAKGNGKRHRKRGLLIDDVQNQTKTNMAAAKLPKIR
jgi:hypothetical protein